MAGPPGGPPGGPPDSPRKYPRKTPNSNDVLGKPPERKSVIRKGKVYRRAIDDDINLADVDRKKAKKLDKFRRIPNLEKERIDFARKSIDWALKWLKSHMRKTLADKNIVLRDTDYYLGIAVKESHLNPEGLSKSNAKGLFQLKTGAGQALNDVNNIFRLKLKDKDVFYIAPLQKPSRPSRPGKPKKSPEPDATEKYKETAANNNAVAGILYWHICRDTYRQKNKLEIPEADRDHVAAFTYKIGPGDLTNLWQTLKPKDFKEFSTKLSELLAKKFPDNFKIPKDKSDVLKDDTYKIPYTSYIYTPKNLDDGSTIRIGNRDYDAANLVQTLRYGEIINSLMNKPPATYEIVQEDYRLWSMADKLLNRCANQYQLPYCQQPDISSQDKIWLMVSIIIRYNNDINNPDFAEDDEDSRDPEVKVGTKIYLPTKDYMDRVIKESQKDVDPVSPTPSSDKIPLYAGKDAAKLAKIGNELIQAPVKKPEMVTPGYLNWPHKGQPLKLDKPTGSGKMPKAAVDKIVIHSTEGNADVLYDGQNAHFAVRRDGTIERILNTNVATSHAGMMKNGSAKRAVWSGDGSPSLHSIGIEVENIALSRLVRDGKVTIEKDKKAKVYYIIRNKVPVYFTDRPPGKKALEEGRKQAKTERGFTDAQYKALKSLVDQLGSEFSIRKKNVVTHSMIATSKFGRGRKSDPPSFDFRRMNLPNNYLLVDPDVASGRVEANLSISEKSRTGNQVEMINYKGRQYYKLIPVSNNGKTKYSYSPTARFGAGEDIVAGTKAAEKIWKEREKQKIFSAHLDIYSISEKDAKKATVDSNMTYNQAMKNLPKNCPNSIKANQRVLTVYYYGYDWKLHQGQIVIHKRLAQDIEDIFALAYRHKFPIRSAIPVSRYNWSDDNSINANNTSSFNYRNIANTSDISKHAYGFAIDINPFQNPNIENDKVFPKGAKYNPKINGTLTGNHPIVKKFLELGWKWGGDWKTPKDYQHFQKTLD